jgi:hypothetical protein
MKSRIFILFALVPLTWSRPLDCFATEDCLECVKVGCAFWWSAGEYHCVVKGGAGVDRRNSAMSDKECEILDGKTQW